jgi:hypothetical protein
LAGRTLNTKRPARLFHAARHIAETVMADAGRPGGVKADTVILDLNLKDLAV